MKFVIKFPLSNITVFSTSDGKNQSKYADFQKKAKGRKNGPKVCGEPSPISAISLNSCLPDLRQFRHLRGHAWAHALPQVDPIHARGRHEFERVRTLLDGENCACR